MDIYTIRKYAINQQIVANLLGVSLSAVTLYMHGKRATPLRAENLTIEDIKKANRDYLFNKYKDFI